MHDGSIYIIGGRQKDNYLNDVWMSNDGINFTQTSQNSPWDTRISHTSISFKSHIWVLGGNSGNNTLLNDVWKSKDGIQWESVSKHADFTPRFEHSLVELRNNQMFIIGGYGEIVVKGKRMISELSDVWGSYDGIDWFAVEPITKSTSLKAVVGHSTIVIDNKIVVIGGGNNGLVKNEIQVSEDGKRWTQLDIG